MAKVHWSHIRMFSKSLNDAVDETPEAMLEFLRQYRDFASSWRDGYHLAIPGFMEWVSIEGENYKTDAIDWTGFDA